MDARSSMRIHGSIRRGAILAADKNFLQRLQEYRSHDHVRVLTLWDTGASAISIQTDHKGDPSLQWTSHLFNRGGATQGLLDHLFPGLGVRRHHTHHALPHFAAFASIGCVQRAALRRLGAALR